MAKMTHTLKEYIESKHVLLKAVKDSPRRQQSYTVTKYCKLKIQVNNTEEYFKLKPKSTVSILWEYNEWHSPTIISMDVKQNGINTKNLVLLWSDEKITKWLKTNTQKD
jgi:hypothetical protein